MLSLEDINEREAQGIDPGKHPARTFELYSVPSFDSLVPETVLGSEIKSGKQRVEPGDVLICKINPRINRVWIVGAKGEHDQISSTEWIIIKPIAGVLPEYLLYFCRSNAFRALLNSDISGVGGSLTRARPKFVFKYKVPIAPLAEQRRIVAQLEATMQKLESSQERLENLPVLLKKFRQAVLAAAVSGKLTEAWRAEQHQGETGTDFLYRLRMERRVQWEAKQRAKVSGKQLSLNDNWKQKYDEPGAPDASAILEELPAGWEWTTVEQIAKVGTGATPLKGNSGYYYGGSIPWITSGALNDLFVDKAEEYITPLAVAETNAKVFPVGTLLVALYGEGKTRGKTSELAIEAATNQACAAIIFDSTPVEVKNFVKLFFLKNYSDLRKLAAGGVQPNLNVGIIKTTRIPFPPLIEQQEIVRLVKHYFDLTDQLEARFEQAAALVEQLPQALLAKAFSGQLVQQDPNDEPASALLERLATQASAPAKGKRGRTPKSMTETPLFN